MKTFLWNPIDRLKTDRARAAYYEAAKELGDEKLIAAVEADIALAQQREAEVQLAKLRRFRGRLPKQEGLSRDAANSND